MLKLYRVIGGSHTGHRQQVIEGSETQHFVLYTVSQKAEIYVIESVHTPTKLHITTRGWENLSFESNWLIEITVACRRI